MQQHPKHQNCRNVLSFSFSLSLTSLYHAYLRPSTPKYAWSGSIKPFQGPPTGFSGFCGLGLDSSAFEMCSSEIRSLHSLTPFWLLPTSNCSFMLMSKSAQLGLLGFPRTLKHVWKLQLPGRHNRFRCWRLKDRRDSRFVLIVGFVCLIVCLQTCVNEFVHFVVAAVVLCARVAWCGCCRCPCWLCCSIIVDVVSLLANIERTKSIVWGMPLTDSPWSLVSMKPLEQCCPSLGARLLLGPAVWPASLKVANEKNSLTFFNACSFYLLDWKPLVNTPILWLREAHLQ